MPFSAANNTAKAKNTGIKAIIVAVVPVTLASVACWNIIGVKTIPTRTAIKEPIIAVIPFLTTKTSSHI